MMSAVIGYYSNIIGIVGVVMVLIVYFLLQINRLSQSALVFSLTNFIGSVLILISLAYHYNLASFVIEVAWLLISLFGVIRCLCFAQKKEPLAPY